jgi:hypothetical protein
LSRDNASLLFIAHASNLTASIGKQMPFDELAPTSAPSCFLSGTKPISRSTMQYPEGAPTVVVYHNHRWLSRLGNFMQAR